MAKENITAYRLTAEDATAQAWNSAQKTAADGIGRIQSLIPGLAAALGAAGLVTFTKQGIDAADHLNDLSKSTAISVEKLAGLQLLARQTGTDLDGLAKAVNKMSVEVGKDPEKFKALGITATDNTERFKQFADLFNTLPDIAQRNALANAVFGKSWAELAPALSEGGKRIGEIIEKGTKLSGVTTEIAQQADKFNDKWAELTGTGAMFNRVIGPALPLLNELADSMIKAGENSQKLNSSFKPVAETLKALMILGANVSFVFETMGKDVARAFENIKLIAQGDFAGSRALGEMFKKDAAEARAALDEYEKRIMALGLTGKPAAEGEKPDAKAQADASRRAAEFLGTETDARDKLNNSMHEQWEFLKLINDQEGQFQKAVAETIAITRKLEDEHDAQSVKFQEQQAQEENAAGESSNRILEMRAALDADKAKRLRDSQIAVLDSLNTERQNEEQDYVQKQQILQERYQNDYDNRAFWYKKIWALDQSHQKTLNSIEDAGLKSRFNINTIYRKADIDSALFFSNQLAGLMQTKSRALFEIGKVGAITGAIIDTYKAATGSYAALAGIPIIGPALGAAAAAAALAIGFARVQAIRSTTYNGGGAAAGTVGTYNASPNTGLPTSPVQPVEPVSNAASTQAPAKTEKVITLQILGDGLFTAAQIRDSLIPLLNDAVGDGVTLRASTL